MARTTDADNREAGSTTAARAEVPPPPGSFAVRLEHLFRVVHPAARGPYSNREVSSAIRAAGGPTISGTYVWQLRNGLRDNPTMAHLEALAHFFGVPITYFFDDDTAERVDGQLHLLAALRDAGVRDIALRSSGLSAQSLTAIQAVIDRARELEGLPAQASDGSTGPGARDDDRRRDRP